MSPSLESSRRRRCVMRTRAISVVVWSRIRLSTTSTEPAIKCIMAPKSDDFRAITPDHATGNSGASSARVRTLSTVATICSGDDGGDGGRTGEIRRRSSSSVSSSALLARSPDSLESPRDLPPEPEIGWRSLPRLPEPPPLTSTAIGLLSRLRARGRGERRRFARRWLASRTRDGGSWWERRGGASWRRSRVRGRDLEFCPVAEVAPEVFLRSSFTYGRSISTFSGFTKSTLSW